MAINVYLPEDNNCLSKRGFVWCTKDKRWESKANIGKKEAHLLAHEVNAKVEVIHRGELLVSIKLPVSGR